MFPRKCNGGHHPLYGTTVRASNYGVPPFQVVDEDRKYITGGVSTELFKAVAHHYHFTPELKLAKSAFNFNPDGSIGGSMGEVLYGIVDVSLEQSIELGFFFGTMSKYTYYHIYGYMERKPAQRPRYTNVVNPFDSLTWYATFTTFFAVSLTLWLITASKKGSALKNLMINLQMTFGIMFQEFHMSTKKKYSLNFLTLRMVWIVGSLFISMAFLANLKSSLMKRHFEKRTMTLEEMVDKDMTIHSSDIFTSYLESPNGQSPLNNRLLCQVKKKDTIFSVA